MVVAYCVEIERQGDPDGSVIWLQGLGADGHDFEAIVPELRLPESTKLRFVFPHASVRPVTINGGMEMRAWFDILTLDREGPVDETGIRESCQMLADLVEREHNRGFAYNKIVLAGFSQGGVIAAHTAIRYPHSLAGLMALSTYLPLQESLQNEVIGVAATQSTQLPVFMAHGSFDPVLPLTLGVNARDALQSAGFSVDWHEYPMQHVVCAEEIAAIREWLLSVFPQL